VWFVIAAQLTPVAMLAWRAGGSGVVQAVSTLGSSLWTSLFTSACAATLVIALGIVLGHAREHPWSWIGDTAGVFAFVVPSTVLAIGLVLAWNRPGTQFVYQTAAILIVGWSAGYAVLGSRILARVMAATPCTFEQAAAVAGASYWMRMRQIVVPMHRRALTAAWLVVFIFCFRDLDTAIVFYPPGMETLPIRIFALEANGPQAVVAGLALIQTAVTSAVIVGIAVLLRGKRT
jgi:iron(III) transport system permease protein